MKPSMILRHFGVDPVVDEDELPIGISFIAQAIFRRCPGRLEGNLLSSVAINSFACAKVTVEFESFCLLNGCVLLVVGVLVGRSPSTFFPLNSTFFLFL